MKRNKFDAIGIAMIPILVMLSLIPFAFATPNSINIQGKLTSSSGSIQTGTFNFTFRIYDNYTSGNLLYETNINGTATDSRGVYDVILNNINIPFNSQYYLALKVDNDGEMSPRINLTSVPYSFKANESQSLNASRDSTVNGNINLSTNGNLNAGGTITGNILQANSQLNVNGGFSNGGLTINPNGDIVTQGDILFSGNVSVINVTYLSVNGSALPAIDNLFDLGNGSLRWRNAYFSGNVGIGATTPLAKLQINDSSASGALLVTNVSGSAVFFVNGSSGNVGIGTTSPGSLLEVNKNQNTLTTIGATNANAGTAAVTRVLLTGDTYISAFQQYSSGYSSAGINIANTTLLYSNTPGGINLDADNAAGIIRFYTGGQNERVRVDASGNVGIGTTSPSVPLDVKTITTNNVANFSSTGSTTTVVIDGTAYAGGGVNGNSVLRLVKGTNASNAAISFANGSTDVWDVGTGLVGTTDNLVFYTPATGSAVMTLEKNGAVANTLYLKQGNIGIGTTTPGSALEVNGVGNFSSGIITGASVTGTGAIRLNQGVFQAFNGSSWLTITNGSGSSTQWVTSASNIYFTGGNVGVGTTSPGNTLSVQGVLNVTSQNTRNGDLFVASSGNVGIGTTNPQNSLHINSSSTAQVQISAAGGNTDARLHLRPSGTGVGNIETFIGYDLSFKPGQAESVRFTSTGNVGIGTSSPASKLTVNGSGTGSANPLINFTDTSSSAYVEIGSTGAGSASALQMRKNSTGQSWRMGLGAQSGTDMIEFYDVKNNVYSMVMQNGTGNVGIGTIAPNHKLEINGSDSDLVYVSSANTGLELRSTAASSVQYIDFQNGSTSTVGAGTPDYSGRILYNDAAGFGIFTRTTERVRIDTSGNVGIGTTTPSSTLQVAGTANITSSSTQLLVNSNGDVTINLKG